MKGTTNARNILNVEGGGAGLNIAYALTPPEDTSKIWVQSDTKPEKVDVSSLKDVSISSNEDLMAVDTEQPYTGATYYYDAFTSCYYDKKTNIMYSVCPAKLNGTVIAKCTGYNARTGENFGPYNLIKMDMTTGTILKHQTYYAWQQYYTFSNLILNIANYDDDNLLISFTDYASNPVYYVRYAIVKKSDLFTVTSENISSSGKGNWYLSGITFNYNNHHYIGYVNTSNKYVMYDVDNKVNFQVSDAVTPKGTYFAKAMKSKKYIYTINYTKNTGAIGSANYTVYRYNIEDNIFEDCNLQFSVGGQVAMVSNFIERDGYVIFTLQPSATNAYSSDIYVLYDDLTLKTIPLPIPLRNVLMYDNAENEIIIDGGYGLEGPNTALYKYVISNLYELESNKLLMFYDTLSSNNIPLIASDTLTVNAPISHCWLGDENDIAQSVNMYVYENNLWKGINCLGWTQLKTCTIDATNVAIDLYETQSNTQTIAITPTWANTSGNLTTNCVSSNESLATCSLNGNTLVVNALAVGTPTITISVVDEYGTKFTKSITVTITNTTPTE